MKDIQAMPQYEVNWVVVVEKFPVSFDIKGLVETFVSMDKAADSLIHIEDQLKKEYKDMK